MTKSIYLESANICSAFDDAAIGSRFKLWKAPNRLIVDAIKATDFNNQRVPGQALINIPELIPMVYSGVGKATNNPDDYILRSHRGDVGRFLRREHSLPADNVSVVVYTLEAFGKDPEVNTEEHEALKALGATHVLVALLAAAGPPSPHSAKRFVYNLAGGNREALVWSADEIRAKAKDIASYYNTYSIVAD